MAKPTGMPTNLQPKIADAGAAGPQPGELPRHIGFIMDGNRRWAKQHGLLPVEGHRAGFEALFALIPIIKRMGIPYVSIYVFSAENWSRAEAEVQGVMKLLLWVVKHKLKTFKKEGISIRIIGSRQNVPADVLAALEYAEAETAGNTEGTLGVCFNYGGRQEIVDAAQAAMADGVTADQLTPETFSHYLYHPDIPDLDLVVRTSGERRLSGFMLWRAQYAEFCFTPVLWPDFSEAVLRDVLDEYAQRARRFGT
jgi:undecaprenyl diphosphate synthase